MTPVAKEKEIVEAGGSKTVTQNELKQGGKMATGGEGGEHVGLKRVDPDVVGLNEDKRGKLQVPKSPAINVKQTKTSKLRTQSGAQVGVTHTFVIFFSLGVVFGFSSYLLCIFLTPFVFQVNSLKKQGSKDSQAKESTPKLGKAPRSVETLRMKFKPTPPALE